MVATTYDKDSGSRIYVNGDLRGGQNLAGPLIYGGGTQFLVGSDPAGNTLNGDVAEILVYNRALTTAELETVGDYLNRKYAFTSDSAFGDFRDTNGDGLSDNVDRALGIDPYGVYTPPSPPPPPPPIPGDTTPPVITLTKPANAVPQP
jgi:hypothetical protein